jgi:hypothetical protein
MIPVVCFARDASLPEFGAFVQVLMPIFWSG